MKFYKTYTNTACPPDAKWTASQSEAASQRATLVKAGFKRADIHTNEVEVPTTKKELLQWLNENCN